MKTVSLKLSVQLDARLEATAQRVNKTKSEIIREALGIYLVGKSQVKRSFSELAQDLAGSIEGPEDLGSNPRYMKGYGR